MAQRGAVERYARALGVAVLNKPIKAGKLRASLDTLLTPRR